MSDARMAPCPAASQYRTRSPTAAPAWTCDSPFSDDTRPTSSSPHQQTAAERMVPPGERAPLSASSGLNCRHAGLLDSQLLQIRILPRRVVVELSHLIAVLRHLLGIEPRCR